MRKILLMFVLLLCLVPSLVFGFDLLVNYPRFQVFDDNGDPLSGGKIYTYIAGTSTPKTTYSDRSLSTPHTNPIILDSRGECTSGIFASGLLKIVIKDSDDVTITNGTFDDIKMTDTTAVKDNDADTYVTVENTADEDQVRMYTAGSLRVSVGSYGILIGQAGASVDEFSTDGTMAGNSDDAVPTEQAVTEWTLPYMQGAVVRPQFEYKDGDEIYIDPGVYHHEGTTEWGVYWNAQITFQLGSGGSNAASDDLNNNDWHYIYIDDSAVVTAATNVLTASEFLNDTTEPTWSDAKHGWYNGSDRCIFAVRTDGAAAVLDFNHNAGREVIYETEIVDRAVADLDDTHTDVTLTIPAFTQQAICTFRANYVDTSTLGYWRTNGKSGTHHVTYIEADSHLSVNTCDVTTDTSQVIEVWHQNAGGDTFGVYTQGYHLPSGM